jgi:hypothetical protein
MIPSSSCFSVLFFSLKRHYFNILVFFEDNYLKIETLLHLKSVKIKALNYLWAKTSFCLVKVPFNRADIFQSNEL